MPKLSQDKAAKVDVAEGGSFDPLPEAVYVAVLEGEVTAEQGKGDSPYWKWTFKIDEGSEFAGRKLYLNTSLSEKAEWRLNQVFGAFGVSSSTHTDDLIGRRVKLVVVQRVIQEGARKGDMGNDIRELLPYSEEDATADAPADAASTPPKTSRRAKTAAPSGDEDIY